MHVLGISAYYHDSAACLVRDGEIVAAAQEERFTRRKHDAGFPINAIRYCLREGGIGAGDLEHVTFYDKPFLKFERLLETYFAFAPRGFRSFRIALPVWLREKLFLKSLLERELRALDADQDWSAKLLFGEHHMSHAASAFFPSPFASAAVLTLDGVGEWATSSLAIGNGNQLEVQREIHFPHSIGLLYSAFTYYTGFKVNSGEYKLMGLAPYGEPRYAGLIYAHLIDVKEDGSFRLDQSYFDYCTGLTMTNGKFADLFGGPPRSPDQPLTQKHMDLAASIQKVTDEVMLRLTRAIAKETGQRNLCLAGGVALNCVANGKILRDRAFDNVWIQPAAGDARSPTMKKTLNLKVKYRESLRPFAPSVLREDVADWFELDRDSPYMSIVADVVASRRREVPVEEQSLFGIDRLNITRSEVPAVTHVDFSARIQTVHRETNSRYHALLTEFKRLTGCPVIVNTSFNVRGEPIVCSPTDAFRCFMGTEIESLAIGNAYLQKAAQDSRLKLEYKDRFAPD